MDSALGLQGVGDPVDDGEGEAAACRGVRRVVRGHGEGVREVVAGVVHSGACTSVVADGVGGSPFDGGEKMNQWTTFRGARVG